MLRTRHLLPILGGLLMLILASCDATSSNVGIGLVEQGAEPVVRELTPTVFEQIPFNDVTGAQPRVLAGKVVDPMVGTITTSGYIDFTSSFDSTDTSPLSSVTLRLALDYVYGDTMAPVTLNLHDITEDWESLGRKADTTVTVGGMITTVTFAPTYSLVMVALPETWIADNDTTLRSTLFATSFHGFALEAVSGEAVVGFNFVGSDLRLITEADTFDFDLTRTISGIRREGEPILPEGRVLLQDGAGPGITFNFDLEGFDDTPLNGAILRIFADTASVQAAAANFVRPFLQTVQIVQITEAEDAFLIAEATLSDDGDYRFSDPRLSALFQQKFFGVDLFDHLELRVPVNDNTINFMLLYDAASGEMAPEALLTLSP